MYSFTEINKEEQYLNCGDSSALNITTFEYCGKLAATLPENNILPVLLHSMLE